MDARAAEMIRIDAMWLAVEPVDMRADADRLLMSVVQVFRRCASQGQVSDNPSK